MSNLETRPGEPFADFTARENTAVDSVGATTQNRNAREVLRPSGVPLGEQLIMWWNFIGRDYDEIVGFRTDWQRDVIDHTDAAGRFGTVTGYNGARLRAPELSTVRLKRRR